MTVDDHWSRPDQPGEPAGEGRPQLRVVPDPVPDGTGAESFEVELDEEPETGGPAPVPPGGAVMVTEENRVPIIPAHLRSAESVKVAAKRVAGRTAHRAGYHAVRAPKYAMISAARSPRGAFRVVGGVARWALDAEGAPVRRAAVDRADALEYLRLAELRNDRVKLRAGVLAVGAVVAVVGLLVFLNVAPAWVHWLAAVGVVGVLGWVGSEKDKPITDRAVITPRFRKLTYDIVLRAYYAAGLGHPDRPGQQVNFAPPGMTRDGEGSRVVVDLPYGKGLNDAINARSAIASGLDVAVAQVYISRDPTSHRRHVLWVADRDPLAVPPGRTPLLRCEPTDVWRPAPLGLDERGQLVSLDLLWNSVLIGAQPRQGKTFTARLLGLYAALDPYVKLTVLDGSSKPDWRRFALVADRCSFGLAMTRDGDPVRNVIDTLTEIKADVADRYERLSRLPVEVCPDGKLTRAIARDPAYRMPVRVVFLEEFQEFFDLGEASKEIASLLVHLIKVAPAAGISFVDATQRPSGIGGGGTVGQQFTSFRDNHQVRFALRTGSYHVSDLVLGAGVATEGYDSSLLLPSYKGVGILRGATDDTPTVRCHLADAADAEKILTAARAIRERAGTLTGMAAGEEFTREARDTLADAMAVFGPAETWLSWQALAARLSERIPEHYADVTAEAISAQLRAPVGPDRYTVASVNGKRDGQVLKGPKLADLRIAARARETANR